MAQKVNIILVDDLDGSEAIETITFGLDGSNYEIDLNEEHATAMREAFAGYVGNARKIAGGRRGTPGRKSSASAASDGPSAAEIRDWARSNGHEVPDRGRIPADIREAFESAN